MTVRVIPRLDIKGPNLVKGVHLEGLRVLGKPWDFATLYYKDGADELIYIDVVASLYERNNLSDIVKKTAENIFIPLTVGGGVRTLEDINTLLRAGADKISINTGAIKNPSLIREGAKTFGSQCIVVSIEARFIDNRFEALTDNGRERSGKEVFDWAREVVELGAGEILLTSIDKEGTGRGYHLELTQKLSENLPIPVIACGGCGTVDDMVKVVDQGKADAVCAASLFHYKYLEEKVDVQQYKEEGNIEFIKRNRGGLNFMPQMIKPASIKETKNKLVEHGISCRNDR